MIVSAFDLILAAHLIGACATGVAASYAGIALWRQQESSYRPLSTWLGMLAGFEILSGTLLAIDSLSISAQSLCTNIAVYLAVVFFMEGILYARMKKVSLAFPLVRIAFPIASTLSFLGTAIALGF